MESVRKRGKGKKNLHFLCSSEEISVDILKTSVFKDFKVVGDAESAIKNSSNRQTQSSEDISF